MPTPGKGEKRVDFVRRCVSVVSREEPESKMNYRLAKCYGLYRQWQKEQGNEKDVQSK
jgi:hypothetical protein